MKKLPFIGNSLCTVFLSRTICCQGLVSTVPIMISLLWALSWWLYRVLLGTSFTWRRSPSRRPAGWGRADRRAPHSCAPSCRTCSRRPWPRGPWSWSGRSWQYRSPHWRRGPSQPDQSLLILVLVFMNIRVEWFSTVLLFFKLDKWLPIRNIFMSAITKNR